MANFAQKRKIGHTIFIETQITTQIGIARTKDRTEA